MIREYVNTRFTPFQRFIVGLCKSKGCEATSCQKWRFEKNPTTQAAVHQAPAVSVRVLDDGIILKI